MEVYVCVGVYYGLIFYRRKKDFLNSYVRVYFYVNFAK